MCWANDCVSACSRMYLLVCLSLSLCFTNTSSCLQRKEVPIAADAIGTLAKTIPADHFTPDRARTLLVAVATKWVTTADDDANMGPIMEVCE